MTTARPTQRQLAAFGHILGLSSHTNVDALLRESLAWLTDFAQARAGAMCYHSSQGEPALLQHGQLSEAALVAVAGAQRAFSRRPWPEPSAGYRLVGGEELLELPLLSGGEAVGLLHLLLGDGTPAEAAGDEELLLQVGRAIGAEADKLCALRRVEHDLRELNLLYRVGQALAGELDLKSLLTTIQRSSPEVIGAERCTIMLLDPQTDELVFEAPEPDGSLREVRFPKDRGIAGWVVSHGEGQIVNNVEQDQRWYNAVQRQTGFLTRSILCAPMKARDRIVGVIQVLNKKSGEPFSAQDLTLMTTLASQAAIAIENASLYASLKEERDRLLTKEEEVRHMLARELHDGPTQSVAAIAMNIEFTKRLLQIMPDKVPDELDNLLDLARKTSHDIRTLLFELRPLALETKGLLGALEQYVTRFRDPEGIRLRLEAPPELPPLNREAEAAVFMIIQEAVNNARKHAGPVEVAIRFRSEGGRLIASVSDAGKGFDFDAVQSTYSSRGSLGLLNMQERARLVGAEFEMRSAPGKGTHVELRVPLSQGHAISP
jgi:signal transduction histidine kinase